MGILWNYNLKVPITLHFSSQANETGGSQQTELEGAKRCFNYLKGLGLSIGIFVSDRHKGLPSGFVKTVPVQSITMISGT